MSDEQRIRDEYMRWAESPECAQGTAWEGYQGGYRARDAEVQALREALGDMLSGWRYIRANHGDLYGVGWERAQTKAETALAGEKGSSDA